MTVILPNVLISTSRSATTIVNGKTVTGVAVNKLTRQPAHIQSTIGIMHMLPAGALSAQYRARVDSAVDVQKGDYITSVTLLDGKTAWPGFSFSNTPGNNETWRIVEATEALPGILSYRYLFLDRLVGGGPVY